MTQTTETSRRVQRGMKALDRHFGGRSWEGRVSLTRLDQNTDHYCVLGQLFGSWEDAPPRLSSMLAFFLPSGTRPAYSYLTKCWRDALREERKKQKGRVE